VLEKAGKPQTTAQDSPHVMKVFGLYEDEYKFYIVSELMLGKNLLEDLEKQSIGCYREQMAAEFARQILLGLNHSHSQGVVHRDLKLENIMMADASGKTLKIVDFGFAKVFPPKAKEQDEILGTPLYMAPEVIGGYAYDFKCDVWSLGICLYTMLSGGFPYLDDVKGPVSVLLQVIKHKTFTKEADMRGHCWPYSSDAAKNFVLRMLEKDQNKRASAEELLKDKWLQQEAKVVEVPPEVASKVVENLKRSVVWSLCEI